MRKDIRRGFPERDETTPSIHLACSAKGGLMPTPTQGRLFDSIGHGSISIEVLLLALAAIILLLFWGCKMRSNEALSSPAGPETGQQVYDSDFLKFLAAPKPAPPELAPGLRKVVQFESSPQVRPASPQEGKAGNYEITLDLSPQVLRLGVPEDRGYGSSRGTVETPLYPSFSEANLDETFAPAAALALKAKQFDDGLYACVEIAADAGLDRFPGRKQFLLNLLNGLSADSDRSAAALLTAAAHLGGMQPEVSPEVANQAQQLQSSFLANELRSKPLGFYTWNQALIQVFQRDRMLQTPLEAREARPLAAALSRNDDLLKAYVASLNLNEKLTNPFAGEDLRQAALALKNGGTPSFAGHPALFPPSQAQETNLIKMLYGDQPIPEAFNLADEMVKRLRSGQLNLKPKPNSGWYDYETYALEPLAIPERMPEAQRLHFDETYRQELVGLFKALLALTRETHVKQLEMPTIGAAMRPRTQPIRISPSLTMEPLPTYYLRRARSYEFVREVLGEAFGPEALPKLRRLTAAGPVNLSLDSELTLMEALFHGAYRRSCEEIGVKPEPGSELGSPGDASIQRALLGAWLDSLSKDPDLGKDIRMMVPVFYDSGRGKTKVWAVLGVASKPLSVSYARTPIVKGIKGPGGERMDAEFLNVEFVSQYTQLAYIVSAEVYVTRLLNRMEFRQRCDQKKTFNAIVDSLK
jgi:hypothetical protein